MTQIYLIIILLSTALFSKVVVGENITQFNIQDQFNNIQTIDKKTKKIIFTFSQKNADIVKKFLEKKRKNYLKSKDILFVIDISQISTLHKWFVLNDLERYSFSIIPIKDEKIAQKYLYEKRNDQIMVVNLLNFKVTGIDFFHEIEELDNLIENN